MLAGLRSVWINTTTDSANLGFVVTLCYAALFALIVIAACTTRRRTLTPPVTQAIHPPTP